MEEFELSKFQRNKVLWVFTTFFDINNDGVIEWEDFDIAVEKIRKLHSWEQGSKQHKNALETLRLIWDGLKKYADENQDDKVTKEEWCKMWKEATRRQGQEDLPDWQKRYMDFMFDVNDTSGDRFIDKDEYTTVYTSYGLTQDECHQAFDKFAPNGKVDRNDFSNLWTEYFLSDDPELKGNYLFGVLSET